jgi:hypothetical protein
VFGVHPLPRNSLGIPLIVSKNPKICRTDETRTLFSLSLTSVINKAISGEGVRLKTLQRRLSLPFTSVLFALFSFTSLHLFFVLSSLLSLVRVWISFYSNPPSGSQTCFSCQYFFAFHPPKTMLSSVLVIVPFLAGTFAANDWSTPCVTGQCSYGTHSHASFLVIPILTCRHFRSPCDRRSLRHYENCTHSIPLSRVLSASHIYLNSGALKMPSQTLHRLHTGRSWTVTRKLSRRTSVLCAPTTTPPARCAGTCTKTVVL